MKWVFLITGLIVSLLIIVGIIGYFLPEKHTASVRVIINAEPGKVWRKLMDFAAYPQWRKNLKSVEVISESEWVEIDQHNNRLPLKVTAIEPNKKLITLINSQHLAFGGSWEFDLQPTGNQTIVTITENGEVYNPIFRFVSKFMMGHTANVKQYAGYLEQSFL
ncbi:MAG: polyketide cyclase [Mucilaginibacter sp.]|nr:polyketide cyclase [Mucilaginibacter sp.]